VCAGVNECTSNNGGCTQYCIDTRDSYYCSCQPGFRLRQSLASCSTGDQFCTSTEYGGLQCFCKQPGCDVRPLNNTNCEDVNECVESNGGCEQSCTNTEGSFVCGCKSGLEVANDMRTCNDVDECASPNTCPSTQICVNTHASFYCVNKALIPNPGSSTVRPIEFNAGKLQASEIFGDDESGYTSATVGVASGIAAVVAALLTTTAVLVARHLKSRRRRAARATAGHNYQFSPRLFGTHSSLGHASMASSYLSPARSSDDTSSNGS